MSRFIERLRFVAVVLYVWVGVLAFGYSAAAADRQELRDYRECKQQPNQICIRHTDMIGLNAVISGVLWPLYLSWVYFERNG